MGLERFLPLQQRVEMIVWREDSDEGDAFYTQVRDRLPRRFLVDPPSDPELASRLEPGLVLGLVVVKEPQVITFYPIVHSQQPEGEGGGWWLSYPPDDQYEVLDRRRYVRVPMRIPVQVQRLDTRPPGEPAVLYGVTADVSGGGMLFTAPNPLPVGERLLVTLPIAKDSEALTLSGQVVLCRPNEYRLTLEDHFAISVQFLNVTPKAETTLIRECFRHQVQARRAAD